MKSILAECWNVPLVLPSLQSSSSKVEPLDTMSNLAFVAHKQLHEVLFSFLPPQGVLDYRCVHTACDEVVSNYAVSQVQDVIGQDFKEQEQRRKLHSSLVKLLIKQGTDLGEILAASANGARSIGARLMHGSSKGVTESLNAICRSMKEESVRTLLHADLSTTSTEVCTTFLARVAASASKLVYLSVNGHSTSNLDELMKLVAANCRELQVLDVNFTKDCVTDESMKLIAANCRKLRSLDVGFTIGITDESMKVVAENCHELERLALKFCRSITDESIKLIAANCRSLQVLDLADTHGAVTDESIKLVAVNCRKLALLDVRMTGGRVTDESIKLIAMNCPQLQVLSVSQNPRSITDASIKDVATHCHQLETLRVPTWSGHG